MSLSPRARLQTKWRNAQYKHSHNWAPNVNFLTSHKKRAWNFFTVYNVKEIRTAIYVTRNEEEVEDVSEDVFFGVQTTADVQRK